MKFIINGDREKFSRFVENHPKGHILQTLEWAKVKGQSWGYIYVMVEDDQGEIKAAMLILARKIPVINRYMLYAPRGPVCDMHDFETLRFLMEEVRKLGKKVNAVMLKIDPDIPVEDKEVVANLKRLGFRQNKKAMNFEGIQPRFVFRLDITPSLEELMAKFHSKTRYNIRLAERKGVTVRLGEREDIPTFYKLLQITGLRDNFVVRPLSYFERMYDYLYDRGYIDVALAEYQGRAIAGVICLFCGDKCWYLYGASSNEDRNVMPNYLLQWEMIKWAKELECTMYDFRGVSGDLNPSNPLYGLYRFKKGFGGELVEFIGEFDMVLSPFWYAMWQKVLPAFRRLRHNVLLMLRRHKGIDDEDEQDNDRDKDRNFEDTGGMD